jgi:hypothetical protein
MKTADNYEVLTEMELQKIDFLRNQAHHYMDSAKTMSRKAKKDMSKADNYIQKINIFVAITSNYLQEADTVLTIANIYKDSAFKKNKEAEVLCLALTQEKKDPDVQQNLNYVVQLGAGNNLDVNYFNKAENVKVVIPNDGIKRFVIGLFNSQEDAKECKQKMIQLGYADAFIRTMDSLYR